MSSLEFFISCCYKTSTLDKADNFPPQAHAFTRSKANWILLDDKIPTFENMYDSEKL